MSISAIVFAQTKGKNIYLDLLSAGSASAADVCSEVNYIPLETNDQSLFGEITQLAVTDKYFLIFDKVTNCLLFFSKDGSFNRKIKYEPFFMGGFTITLNNEIILTKGNTNYYYDFAGNKLKTAKQTIVGTPYFLADSIVAFSDYRVSERYLPDSINFEISLLKAGKSIGRFLPYNMKNGQISNDEIMYQNHPLFYDQGSRASVLYCRPYDYAIYNITPREVQTLYRFIFPANSALPKSFFDDKTLNGKRLAYLSSHPEMIYGISFAYQISDCLLFKANSWGEFGSYFYYLKSQKLIEVEKIRPDLSTFYLPLTDYGEGADFLNKNFLTSDGHAVYTTIPAALLIKSAAVNREKNISYNQILTHFFTKGKRTDNPVIVQIKPREF